MYVLINWDESRSGQDNQWALHIEADGTEVDNWPDRPTQAQIAEAKAYEHLPSNANLPNAAKMAAAIARAADPSDYYVIPKPSAEPDSAFPPW